MLQYKNNKPYIEGVLIDDIIKTQVTPIYIYSQNRIEKNYTALKDNLVGDIFYSVKANSNQAIIKLINSMGGGFDVVSTGELKRCLRAGANPEKIIFEGVGKSEEDILFAINNNIRLINAESFEELEKINRIGKSLRKEINIGIRINPDIDSQTLEKISTGKKSDKFGISINEINTIHSLITKYNNLKLIGISCHIGSQIFNLEIFDKVFKTMKDVVNSFIQSGVNIKYLDLGGGIGVQYNHSDPNIDLLELKKLIDLNFTDVPYELSFEPGRYLVANAGIILTKIITTKKNSGTNFLITDAGMNTFIRPSLYNAKHLIEPINNNAVNNFKYTIAGPICESSDVFAKNIEMLEQKSGDYLVIHGTGAYGAVMSSNYNTRELPAEILINKSSIAVIRERENIESVIDNDIIPSWL